MQTFQGTTNPQIACESLSNQQKKGTITGQKLLVALTRSSAIAEGMRDALISTNPALQNISFDNDCNRQMTLNLYA